MQGTILAIVASMLVSSALVLQSAIAATSTEPNLKKIEAMVKRHAELDMFSGTVLLAKNGKPIYAAAFGESNKDHGIPNRLDTPHNIGSIGKTFTATAIMQLVQARRLNLEDTLAKVLPDFPFPERDKISIQHLLNHTSGLGDYMEHETYAAKMSGQNSIADFLPLIYSQKPLFPAGERFSYSNSGMVLLGAIIEKISGQHYADYLRQHIFIPAGLNETALAQEHEVLPRRSTGYSPRPNGRYQANVRAVMPASADGGLRTTVMDLLRFDQALNNHKLLDEQHHQQMITPVGAAPFMANGWFVNRANGRHLVGHSGGAPGVSAEFRRYRDAGYTLVVLSNYDGVASSLAEQIEKVLFGLEVAMPTQEDADYGRAQHFESTEQIDAALRLFDKHAHHKQPHLPSVYAGARLRIVSKTEPEKAVKALEQYIERTGDDASPSKSAAWWRKGNAYELMGKKNEARHCYEQALKLNPNEHEAAKSLTALAASD